MGCDRQEGGQVKIQILLNNDAQDKGLSIGWGFSALVDERVLFDTGESDEYLFDNIASMNVDISKIGSVVISHDHWDHWGGLWELLKRRRGMDVYACPGFGEDFKEKVKGLRGNLIELAGPKEIDDNIHSTGEIEGEYGGRPMPEQALVVASPKGISVITGCAHPGIVEMMKGAKASFPDKDVYAVLGGFHLMDKDRDHIARVIKAFRDMNVKKAGPTHCSGKKAERMFSDEFKGDFINVGSGMTLEV